MHTHSSRHACKHTLTHAHKHKLIHTHTHTAHICSMLKSMETIMDKDEFLRDMRELYQRMKSANNTVHVVAALACLNLDISSIRLSSCA